MNTHVDFEISQLLKEKGFNEPCQYLRVGGSYRINFEKEGELFNNKYPSTQIPNDWCLCPTIADVVIWLYEKHDIWITVNICVIGSDEWEYGYIITYLPSEFKNEKYEK